MWAFLVGISKYADSTITEVPGAIKDIDDVRQYLLEIGVPDDNIVSLRDNEATRESIISGFRTHLIDNKAISKGDAILFHFSGHGAQCKAPEGWPIIEKDSPEDKEKGLLEVIIPYDGNMPNKDTEETCGIPDRTIAVLLELAALERRDGVVGRARRERHVGEGRVHAGGGDHRRTVGDVDILAGVDFVPPTLQKQPGPREVTTMPFV